jgi:hypothetical protein
MRFTTDRTIIPETSAEIVSFGWEVILQAEQHPWTRERSVVISSLKLELFPCNTYLDAGARIAPDKLHRIRNLTDELIRLLPPAQVKAGNSDEENAA